MSGGACPTQPLAREDFLVCHRLNFANFTKYGKIFTHIRKTGPGRAGQTAQRGAPNRQHGGFAPLHRVRSHAL
jgi:hypothetical protein